VDNLALVLRYQGKYFEAEVISRQALEGSEKGLGKQHPDTLTSIDNLAVVAARLEEVRRGGGDEPASAGKEREGAGETAPVHAHKRLQSRVSPPPTEALQCRIRVIPKGLQWVRENAGSDSPHYSGMPRQFRTHDGGGRTEGRSAEAAALQPLGESA